MNIKYKKFNSVRKFGVEFELSNNLSKRKIKSIIEKCSDKEVRTTRYALSYKNNYWHIKNDSSCGPEGSEGPSGIEIATYICSGLKDANHVSDVLNNIKFHNAQTNNFCGVHVHVDVSDFSENDIGRLMLYWMAIEKVLIYALPSSRWNNKYCRFLNPDINHWVISYLYYNHDSSYIANFFRPRKDPIAETTCKRSSLNVMNFFHAIENESDIRKTVEFRCPEGTLSGDDAKSWILLFVNFVDYIKSKKSFPVKFFTKNMISVKDMLFLFGLHHDNTFNFFDENFLLLRKWLLHRIIENVNSDLLDHSFKQNNAKKEAKTLLDRIYKLN